MNEIHPLISSRRSPFTFSDKIPDNETLDSLFLAASRAPSGFNRQPWRFLLAVKGEKAYTELFSILNEGNRRWANEAPVLVLVLTIRETKERGTNSFAGYEAGMAVGNLLVQAAANGLLVHQMGGYDRDLARKHFAVPDTYDLLTVMAIGYPGNEANLPLDFKERGIRSSARLGLAELVSRERIKT